MGLGAPFFFSDRNSCLLRSLTVPVFLGNYFSYAKTTQAVHSERREGVQNDNEEILRAAQNDKEQRKRCHSERM